MALERPTLQKIEPPSKDRTPLDVAKELLKMYRKDYFLTIAALCEVFCCERQWVEDFILQNVKHIYITQYFRKYIVDNLGSEMSKTEKHDFTYSFYFVSSADLVRFYKEEAFASQMTTMTDISAYRKNASGLNELLEEKSRHLSTKASKKEKERHLSKMGELLTPKGMEIYEESRAGSWEWVDTALPPLKPLSKNDTEKLTSTAKRARAIGFSANTAYKQLCRSGAVRIKFGGKMLWITPDYPGSWLIPVQAK